MKSSLRIVSLLGLALFASLACQLTQPAAPDVSVVETTPVAPSATPLPAETLTAATETLVPSAPAYEIVREPVSEEAQTPNYIIDLVIPRLVGPQGPAVDNFNVWISENFSEMMATFKTGVAEEQALVTPDPSMGSTISGLNSEYEILYQSDELISLMLKHSQYHAGAAHPQPFAQTVNYSLSQARVLALEELFQPGAPYLEAISSACLRELQKLEYVTDLEGAAPLAENYRNWNITADGLLITFEPYQVAAYAAGYISVTVPYAEIQEIIDPAGPLSGLIP